MTMFDTEITVLSTTIGTPSEEMLAAGAPPRVELGIISGLALPIPNPQSGQPLVIPVGTLRFTFNRDEGIGIFSAGVAAAETLPETFAPSGKVMVASNMSEVATAAENIRRATGR